MAKKVDWVLFNRLRICLTYWLSQNYKIYWVTLTSSPESSDLYSSYKKLIQRIEVRARERPAYCRIKTMEGYGVLHCFLVFKGKGLPCSYKWLSQNWQQIHGAWNVSIRKIGGRGADADRVAMYSATQYASNQNGKVRVDWSRDTYCPAGRDFIKDLRKVIRQEAFPFNPWHCTMAMVLKAALDILSNGYARVSENNFVVDENYNPVLL